MHSAMLTEVSATSCAVSQTSSNFKIFIAQAAVLANSRSPFLPHIRKQPLSVFRQRLQRHAGGYFVFEQGKGGMALGGGR